MLAILGGLGAALCWATASMASARSARRIGAWSTVAWVMLIGTVIMIPVTAIGGEDVTFTPTTIGLLVVSGVANVIGLLLIYTAFRRGNVAVLAPIVSTEGAMGAVLAIILGEQVRLPVVAVLGMIVVGVVVSASAGGTRDERPPVVEPGSLSLTADPDDPPASTRSAAQASAGPKAFVVDARSSRTALLALAGAACFGINLYASARIGRELSIVWSILPARIAGTIGLALPLLITRRIRLTRAALPFVAVVAVAEIVGLASYAFGARSGIAVASVMSSQFGAIAAVVSVVLFGERLRWLQVGGIFLIATGVALLAALQSG
jgi:drug/metabolite transporter (DMT)-like permease